MLQKVADGVYEVVDALRMPLGARLPVRSTVVTTSGGVCIISPLALDDATARAIAEMGPVKHIVGPNLFHHLYLRGAKERFGDARLWASPGLEKKRSNLPFDGVIDPKAPFAEELRPFALRGVPKLGETMFFHEPSGTLVVADALFHIVDPENLMSRLAFTTTGVLGGARVSRVTKMLTKDEGALRETVNELLELPIERILVGHGDVVAHDAREELRRAFGYLLGS